jgi:hypothetical protein
VSSPSHNRPSSLRGARASFGVRLRLPQDRDEGCSATTLWDRRDEWIEIGVIDSLREIVLEAYDRIIGLELSEVAVDCCITKAPCGARFGVGRRTTRGGQRAFGPWLRLRAHPRAPARARATHRDLPEGQAGTAWDNQALGSGEDEFLARRSQEAGVVHGEAGRVVDFWVAFSKVVIIVRQLIREGWIRYRWEGCPSRGP